MDNINRLFPKKLLASWMEEFAFLSLKIKQDELQLEEKKRERDRIKKLIKEASDGDPT